MYNVLLFMIAIVVVDVIIIIIIGRLVSDKIACAEAHWTKPNGPRHHHDE